MSDEPGISIWAYLCCAVVVAWLHSIQRQSWPIQASPRNDPSDLPDDGDSAEGIFQQQSAASFRGSTSSAKPMSEGKLSNSALINPFLTSTAHHITSAAQPAPLMQEARSRPAVCLDCPEHHQDAKLIKFSDPPTPTSPIDGQSFALSANSSVRRLPQSLCTGETGEELAVQSLWGSLLRS